MSKQDKDLEENGPSGDRSPEGAADTAERLQALPVADSAADNAAKSERSRQFNAWLDRTLPLLQEALGGSTTGAVTSPGRKTKH